MAVAVEEYLEENSSVLEPNAVDYVRVENITYDHRLLNLDEVDPGDVVMFDMVKHGVPLFIPPGWEKNGHHYWSKTLDGLAFQRQINALFPPYSNQMRHRWFSQLREQRDFADLRHIKGISLNELAFLWVDKGDAERFAREYKQLFLGPESLYALVNGWPDLR